MYQDEHGLDRLIKAHDDLEREMGPDFYSLSEQEQREDIALKYLADLLIEIYLESHKK